jgi:hypothetical protein
MLLRWENIGKTVLKSFLKKAMTVNEGRLAYKLPCICHE